MSQILTTPTTPTTPTAPTTAVTGTSDSILKNPPPIQSPPTPPTPPTPPSFGFIVLRHVNNDQTALYWVECCARIRRFYPEVPIVIIDDNSNPAYIDSATEEAMYKCTIVRTIFHKRGELLPYYYYTLHNWFEVALIIHDSVFINSYIDFESHMKYKLPKYGCMFLWHFNFLYDNRYNETAIMENLQNAPDLLEIYNDSASWRGCFGVMSLIRRDFLMEMEQTYAFSGLLSHITSRPARMALERAFACMVFDLQNKKNNNINPHNISILGCIHDYCKWGYSYSAYMQNINNYAAVLPIIKIWSGR